MQMTLVRPPLAALLAFLAAASEAAPSSFADAPIACGVGPAYTACRASFDGWTLTIAYGGASRPLTAVYRKCAAERDMIHCAEGEWRSGTATGPLPARSIGLKDGRPFPN
jgi:hypothetical protein